MTYNNTIIRNTAAVFTIDIMAIGMHCRRLGPSSTCLLDWRPGLFLFARGSDGSQWQVAVRLRLKRAAAPLSEGGDASVIDQMRGSATSRVADAGGCMGGWGAEECETYFAELSGSGSVVELC